MRWQILNDLDYKHYMQEYKINSLLAKIFAYKNYSNPQVPNPWDRLQPQDATSRHRGAKPPRRCELLGEISLLSPG